MRVGSLFFVTTDFIKLCLGFFVKKYFSFVFLSFIAVSLYAPPPGSETDRFSPEAADRIRRIRDYHGDRPLRPQSPGGSSPLHRTIVLKADLARKKAERKKTLDAYYKTLEDYSKAFVPVSSEQRDVGFTPSDK